MVSALCGVWGTVLSTAILCGLGQRAHWREAGVPGMFKGGDSRGGELLRGLGQQEWISRISLQPFPYSFIE